MIVEGFTDLANQKWLDGSAVVLPKSQLIGKSAEVDAQVSTKRRLNRTLVFLCDCCLVLFEHDS